MIDAVKFFNVLHDEGINYFSGVPDSLLKDFCAYLTDNTTHNNHIIAANEGNALSLGIGYYLASNKLPLIYMQNSGLGNVVNPLLSLADPDVYSVPMLLMIGWRGEPNVRDEPQHKKQGRVTIELLDAMEVPYEILDSNSTVVEVKDIVKKAVNFSRENNRPYALVVRKGSFEGYKLRSDINNTFALSREKAIKLLVNELNDDDVVVSTTGVASRELFEYRETLGQGHEKDFLTVGGMGHASQIALGIALQKSDRNIVCFDGDGAVLMHMGSLAIIGSMRCKNIKHVVFNNGAHDSVGGQPTVGFEINLTDISIACGYRNAMSVCNYDDIKSSIKWFMESDGPVLLEIKVSKGSRSNLGRPTTTPIDNKIALMGFLSSNE